MYTAMIALQHSGASFNESVVRLVCTFEVFAVGYTRTDAIRRAAKVQGIMNLRVLVGTVKAEQPSAADAATAGITPRIPAVHVCIGKSRPAKLNTHSCIHVYARICSAFEW
jgi:hypothetical protein